ncbi:MAG TPA: quinolinate synthase NadA [Rhizomicrobium sp.]|jgi:quinolinate synthase|nr:quinolinate synthase NadA [Rhizomicrobium sp.]
MEKRIETTSTAEELPYTDEVARETRALYEKVAHVVPEIEWAVHAPYIYAINKLKREKNAVILGHNYMTPEIFNCVSDFTGDSLQLAREAAHTDAQVIVQAGVHFMAETSKILSPHKTVLIPDPEAGCSLAASITGADVRLLKEKYPGLPVVTYVNTSADVKAESTVCCTSSNAVAVVEEIAAEWGVETVIMVPDEYLAQNVAKLTGIKIITWKGRCEVHERFTADDIKAFRESSPGVVVLAHPECSPEVVAAADFAGSTSALIGYVGEKRPNNVVLVTECSMSDNVAVEFPDVNFVRPCNLCPYMKRITLPKILHALQTMTTKVEVDPVIAARAKAAVDRMLAVKLPVKKAA